MSNAIHLSAQRYAELQRKAEASRVTLLRSKTLVRPEPKPCKPSRVTEPPPVRDAHAASGKMTGAERKYLREILHGNARFEPVQLSLLGGSRYTPDFMTRENGITVFHEVKGTYHLASHNRAQTAFREAASQFPWCRFVWAEQRKDSGWDISEIPPISDTHIPPPFALVKS